MTSIPATMTAIAIQGKGGPEVLVPEERATPAPGPKQVLVKVRAAGVNRPDILQRQGLYPAPKGHSDLPGLEIAGEVAATGPATARWKPGDPVMALVNGGGYAEYCVADEALALPVPPNLTIEQAGGVPETTFTVWHNVFERGGLKGGEWLLVHGGTSGIGVTAIQLATAFGAKVIATAGSEAKCAVCRELGAVRAVDYTREDFTAAVKEATGGRGVDVILDIVGGDYVARNLRCLAEDGRLVNIGHQKGPEPVPVDMMRVMLKRQTLTGSTLRVRTPEIKAAIARGVETNVLPLLADGRVRVLVDSTYPLRDAAAAHRRMETSRHIGKIILVV